MNTCISRFGIRIGDRKYLNEYTPFGSVSLWDDRNKMAIMTTNGVLHCSVITPETVKVTQTLGTEKSLHHRP